jgi:hypothetical protein
MRLVGSVGGVPQTQVERKIRAQLPVVLNEKVAAEGAQGLLIVELRLNPQRRQPHQHVAYSRSRQSPREAHLAAGVNVENSVVLQFSQLRPNFDAVSAAHEREHIRELIGVFGAVDGQRSQVADLWEAGNIDGRVTEVHRSDRQIVHAPQLVDVGLIVLLEHCAQGPVEAEEQRVDRPRAEGMRVVDHGVVSGVGYVVPEPGNLRRHFRERLEQVVPAIAVPQRDLVRVGDPVVRARVHLRLAIGPHRLAEVIGAAPANVGQRKQGQKLARQRIDQAGGNAVAGKGLAAVRIDDCLAQSGKVATALRHRGHRRQLAKTLVLGQAVGVNEEE